MFSSTKARLTESLINSVVAGGFSNFLIRARVLLSLRTLGGAAWVKRGSSLSLPRARRVVNRFGISPLIYSLCWGFAIINLLIGLGLIFLFDTPVPIAVANILSYPEWGLVFIVLSLIGAYFLIQRNATGVLNTQIFSVFVKCIWLIALGIRCFTAPTTIIITLVWGFFAYVQIMICVYFDTPLLHPTIPSEVRDGNNS
jgi:hypothetical protein